MSNRQGNCIDCIKWIWIEYKGTLNTSSLGKPGVLAKCAKKPLKASFRKNDKKPFVGHEKLRWIGNCWKCLFDFSLSYRRDVMPIKICAKARIPILLIMTKKP